MLFFGYSNSSAQPYNAPPHTEETLEELDGQEDEENENMPKKKTKRPGRRSRWSEKLLNDFIDIIVSNEQHKTKLIFRNLKFQQNGEIYGRIREELQQRCAAREQSMPFSIDQLRSKFKKCVSECKRAALTIKTGTGIKRFQEDKGYGA